MERIRQHSFLQPCKFNATGAGRSEMYIHDKKKYIHCKLQREKFVWKVRRRNANRPRVHWNIFNAPAAVAAAREIPVRPLLKRK